MKKYDDNFVIEQWNYLWSHDLKAMQADIVNCTDQQLKDLTFCVTQAETDFQKIKEFAQEQTFNSYWNHQMRDIRKTLLGGLENYYYAKGIIYSEEFRRAHFKSMAFDYDGLAA